MVSICKPVTPISMTSPTFKRSFLWVWCSLLAIIFMAQPLSAIATDGNLKMEVITAYNFVVDSNVESPSSVSPSAAHLGAKITNTGSTTLTNVVVNIGTLTTPSTSTGTPGYSLHAQ